MVSVTKDISGITARAGIREPCIVALRGKATSQRRLQSISPFRPLIGCSCLPEQA